MARADLSSMLGRLDDAETDRVEPGVSKQGSSASVAPPVSLAPSTTTSREALSENNSLPASIEPLYLRLERKETRLRADQYSALTEHARRLNRAKKGGGERITENTLIRIAVDLLLTQVQDLQGKTEDELRNSVTP